MSVAHAVFLALRHEQRRKKVSQLVRDLLFLAGAWESPLRASPA